MGEKELAFAAAAGHASRWSRHAREDLQGSHVLTEPLAKWIAEPAEQPPRDVPSAEGEAAIAIPEPVLHPRSQHRLPEDAVCRSPICGLVIAVLAASGQAVKRGQPVVVIEAMKMQNNVCPAVDGLLKAVRVTPGEAVKGGQILFELEVS